MKIYAGDLGTFAGLKTDEKARVLDASGQAIEGLYAVGNDMSHIMSGEYMSGGTNLGPGADLRLCRCVGYRGGLRSRSLIRHPSRLAYARTSATVFAVKRFAIGAGP